SISMAVDHVRQLLVHQPEAAGEELDRLQQIVARASREARVLLFELRPIALETHGLAGALETYVEQLQTDCAPKFHFDDGGFADRLPSDIEATAFVVVQEAVNNARKHAAASNIWLRIVPEKDHVVISVEDDGHGFDPDTVPDGMNREAHLGLVSMQERAQLIDAELEIRSAPGHGSGIALRVPRAAREG
ncbi:MAG TPA: sensor histidine kinase, partial [Chloroflexi bacterium]|nr:sensor histidine kinase [Chloroflexota bacterium]